MLHCIQQSRSDAFLDAAALPMPIKKGCAARRTGPYRTGSLRYSRSITGTEVGGMAPNSVMISVTYSAGMASYTRFSSPACRTPV